MTAWVVIANKAAGSADRSDILRAAAVLGDCGDVQVSWTETPGDLDEVLDTAPGALVAIAGGDGSVHAVVNALHRRDELDRGCVIVPLGTGNDLARGLDLPLDPVAAVTGLDGGTTRELFTMQFGDELVINNIHAGAGARAAMRADRWNKKLGRLTYPVAAAAELFRPEGIECHVQVDGALAFSGEAEAVFVATGPTIGGGLAVAPDADAADPSMSTVILPLLHRPVERLRQAWTYLRNGVDDVSAVGQFQGTDVTITSVRSRDIPIDVDGELETVDGPIRLRLGPPWRLLVPAATD